MRALTILCSILALAIQANAATYYVSSAGSDANNGTSTATPWAHHPYMRNFTGAYTHAAGDRFIFRGGDTWGNACFTMQVMAGGTPSTPDYYGVDQTWFAGAAWTRPVFDAGGVELAGGYDVMVLLSLANAPHDIVFDNLDLRNLFWTGAKSFSQVAFFNLSVSQNVTIQNCFLHNWTHGTAGAGTSDSLKCVVGANSSPFNYGCQIVGCVIDGENAANSTQGQSSGEATIAYSGNVLNTVARNMASGFIVTGAAGSTTPQVVSGCEIGPTYMSFDSGAHPDALFMNGGSLFYWHDNYIHDNAVENVFCGNGSGTEQTFIWNNVIWSCPTHSPVEIDNISAASGHVYLWNNTLVGGGFPAVRVVNRGNGPLGSLDLRNNHGITDSSFLAIDAGGGVTALTNANNVTQTTTLATLNGYTTANRFKPTSPNSPTVDVGQDLSAVLGGVINMDASGFIRPLGLAFDAGAYEWLSSPASTLICTNSRLFSFAGSGAIGTSTIQYPMLDNGQGRYFIVSSDGTTIAKMSDGGAIVGNADFQSNVVATLNYVGTGVQCNRYGVASVFSTNLTLIDSTMVGDSDSRVSESILFMESGALIFAWHQHTAVATNGGTFTMLAGVAYLPPGSSTWKIHYPLFLNGTTASIVSPSHLTVAQHPGDHAVWFFGKRDSYSTMFGIRCAESAGDVVVSVNPNQLSQAVYGTFGPEGENPFICAVPDLTNGKLLLVYQRELGRTFSFSPFYKGAYLSIASLDTNGTPTNFVSLNQYVERTQSFGVAAGSNGVSIAYNTISSNGIIPVAYLSTYKNGAWINQVMTTNSKPQFGYIRHTSGAVWGEGQNANQYLIRQQINSSGTLALSTSAQNVSENGGFVGVTVVRNGGNQGIVSVVASTANGTAVAGHDYGAVSASLFWADGVTGARSFTVPILASGDTATTNRLFTVNLSGATGGAAIGAPATQTVTIVMNPPATPATTNGGTISFAPTSYTTTMTAGSVALTVARSGGTNAAASVSYTTFDGTAKAGTDYTAANGTLSWGVNENSAKTIVVPITNSGKQGAPVNFTVALSNPTNGARLSAALASVSITLNPVVVPVSGVAANGKVVFNGSVSITFK